MVNPTFQNQGTASVSVDGRLLDPGDSYSVSAPVVLQNEIPITFSSDKTLTRQLYIGYVDII